MDKISIFILLSNKYINKFITKFEKILKILISLSKSKRHRINLKSIITMKIKYIIILSLFLGNNIYAQDNIISQLKQFSKNADIDCYLDKIQKRTINYYYSLYEYSNMDITRSPIAKIESNKEKIIPILTIQFVNTENYNFGDDIYKHITIDSTRVFTLVYVDKRNNISAYIGLGGLPGYLNANDGEYKGKKKRNIEKILININKQHPDLILYCGTLSSNDDGFMYIKNDKIFVYRVVKGDSFELNEYITKFYRLDGIRSLNYSIVPVFDINADRFRRTGHDPKNELIVCPSKLVYQKLE